jgi:hypothetical protein
METLDKHSLHTDPDKRNACQRMMNEVAQARTRWSIRTGAPNMI